MKQAELDMIIDKLTEEEYDYITKGMNEKLAKFKYMNEFIDCNNPKLRMSKVYYNDYKKWCRAKDIEPVAQITFNKQVCLEWECFMATVYDRDLQRVGYGFKPY